MNLLYFLRHVRWTMPIANYIPHRFHRHPKVHQRNRCPGQSVIPAYLCGFLPCGFPLCTPEQQKNPLPFLSGQEMSVSVCERFDLLLGNPFRVFMNRNACCLKYNGISLWFKSPRSDSAASCIPASRENLRCSSCAIISSEKSGRKLMVSSACFF